MFFFLKQCSPGMEVKIRYDAMHFDVLVWTLKEPNVGFLIHLMTLKTEVMVKVTKTEEKVNDDLLRY